MPSCRPRVKHVNDVNGFHAPNREKQTAEEWLGMSWNLNTHIDAKSLTAPRQVYTDLGNMLCESFGMTALSTLPVKLLTLVIANGVSTGTNKKHHLRFRLQKRTHWWHISTPPFRVKDNCLGELDNIGLFYISGPPYLYHPEKSSSSRSVSLPIPHIVNALATSLSVLMARN